MSILNYIKKINCIKINFITTERIDQLAVGCSNLTKRSQFRVFGNATAIKLLGRDSFAALMVLPGSNLD